MLPLLLWKPIEDDYRQLWNQLDVFGKGERYLDLRELQVAEAQKRSVAKRFLVRRVTTLTVGGQPPKAAVVDDRTIRLELPEPRLWWPWDQGEQNLYWLTAELTADGESIASVRELFGLRDVELLRSPERFVYRINGRDVYIRGSSYMPGLYLSECTTETSY